MRIAAFRLLRPCGSVTMPGVQKPALRAMARCERQACRGAGHRRDRVNPSTVGSARPCNWPRVRRQAFTGTRPPSGSSSATVRAPQSPSARAFLGQVARPGGAAQPVQQRGDGRCLRRQQARLAVQPERDHRWRSHGWPIGGMSCRLREIPDLFRGTGPAPASGSMSPPHRPRPCKMRTTMRTTTRTGQRGRISSSLMPAACTVSVQRATSASICWARKAGPRSAGGGTSAASSW